LAKLFETLSKNQKVVDAFSTATNFLSVAFSDLFKFIESSIEPVTDYFKALFEDPVQSLKDFGQAIVDNLIERFNSLLDTFGHVGKALSHLVEGEFGKAWDSVKEAGKEVVDVVTGVDGSVDKLIDTTVKGVKALKDYTKSTYNTAKAITAADKAADKAATTFGLLNAQLAGDAAEQERILADEFASIEDKYTALEKLTGITESLHKAEKDKAETLLKQAQIAYDLNASDENRIALQNEKIALMKLETSQLADQDALFDKRIAINDQWNEDQLAKQDREKESADFLLALQQENTLGLIEDLQERALAELKIQEEKELASAELMENSEEIKEQIRQKYARLRGEVVKKMSENEIAWEDMTQEQKLNKVKNSAGEMAKILGEESEAGKAFAITQATIDTFQGANAAYSSMAKIPYVGPVLGGIAAAAAIASGMANVKAIASASPASSGGGGGGGGSTAPARPAPQMMSGAFDIEGGIEPEATKAYVVTDEMTSSQNQLANIRRRATI
jgi:hypothetical protein